MSSLTFDAAAGAFVPERQWHRAERQHWISTEIRPRPITQTINLNMAWSASETIDTPTNGNLTLGGNITSSADTSLIKLDAGTLTAGRHQHDLELGS